MDEKAIIEKIKRIRRNQNMTLKALSKRTGLTEGYLSRIENSESAPPISTLSRIARGLNLDISFLLTDENEVKGADPAIVIDRGGEIANPASPEAPNVKSIHGYVYETRALKKRGKNMVPCVLISDFEPGEVLQHEGEEFLYVLEGAIEFFYGTEKFILNQGDSAYFDGHIPHNGRSIGDKKARVLIVFYLYKRL
jgi:transcriptional regulator with XRE-family HTH domain